MLYRAKVALCSEINPKHTIIMCGQSVKLLNFKPIGESGDHEA
jgi:hypothetical protein